MKHVIMLEVETLESALKVKELIEKGNKQNLTELELARLDCFLGYIQNVALLTETTLGALTDAQPPKQKGKE